MSHAAPGAKFDAFPGFAVPPVGASAWFRQQLEWSVGDATRRSAQSAP